MFDESSLAMLSGGIFVLICFFVYELWRQRRDGNGDDE
jgi:hypothetical protein